MRIIDIKLSNNYEVKGISKLDDEHIVFAQIRDHNLFLYKQNINTDKVTQINQNPIECNEYIYPTIKIVNEKIMIKVGCINEEIKKIYRINSKIKEEKLSYTTNKDGNYIFLNDRYVLLLGQHEIDMENYYSEIDYNYAYLIDLDENKEYEVSDKKVKNGIRYDLPMYTKNNKTYIILEELHMEDYEAEDIYHNHKCDSDFQYVDNQSINIIGLDDFIKDIKEYKNDINFKIICEKNYNEYINYFGQNEDEFFYRYKKL